MTRLIFAFLFLSGPVLAECPAARDITADMDVLISEIRSAPDDRAARDVSGKLWELWLTAPDAAAQEALDNGMRRRANYDFQGALVHYDKLVDYCPSYAEGYNQRAFIYFLTGDYEKALVDLDAALALSPRHVGALSGRALTLMNLGRTDDARTQLIAALDVNPWLSERFLMMDGGPLAPKGEDL